MSSVITSKRRESRSLDKRIYGDEIAEALNSATPGTHVLRVRKLVLQLKAIVEALAQLDSACRVSGLPRLKGASRLGLDSRGLICAYDVSANKKLMSFMGDIKQAMNETEALLQRYRWHPSLRVNSRGILQRWHTWPSADANAEWENSAVEWLLSQLSNEFDESPIMRFSLCEQCGNWFYAGRDGAKFCRSSCRVGSYLQKPEAKAKRAEYMRDHRSRMKSRELAKQSGSQKSMPRRTSRQKGEQG